MEWKNSKYMCYFEFSHSGFPRSQDKRAGISKKMLSFFTLFLYIPWNYPVIIACFSNTYEKCAAIYLPMLNAEC